jgi:hypothetical protein
MLKPPKRRRQPGCQGALLLVFHDYSQLAGFLAYIELLLMLLSLIPWRGRGNGGSRTCPVDLQAELNTTPPPGDVFSAFARPLFDGICPLHKQWLPFSHVNYLEHSQEPYQSDPNVYYR